MTTQWMPDEDGVPPTTGAVFSEDRTWRYSLYRRWDHSLPYVNFIGLNPSTADEEKDDATIRRVINYARAWGFGALVMTNLYAYRSTDPRVLRWLRLDEAVGPENDTWLLHEATYAGLIILGWGNTGLHHHRGRDVIRLLNGLPLHYIQRNKDGSPAHPLYLSKALTPLPWPGKES
jgi:hypothetical protein